VVFRPNGEKCSFNCLSDSTNSTMNNECIRESFGFEFMALFITSNYFKIYMETSKTIQTDCSMIMYFTNMLKIKTVIVIKKIQ